MWYYEEWTMLGVWSARTQPTQPSAITASGTKRKIRAVREVPENMTGYDLNVLRDWSDAMIAKEAAEASGLSRDKEIAEAAALYLPEVPSAVRVKPLSWREIDPGHRLVGTGLGFTCEIHHLHRGGWEAVWPLSNAEFPDALSAKAAMEDAYAALVLSFVVLP